MVVLNVGTEAASSVCNYENTACSGPFGDNN